MPWKPLGLALVVAAIVPTLQNWVHQAARTACRVSVAGAHPLGQFPILPWLSYTLTGAAVGALCARPKRQAGCSDGLDGLAGLWSGCAAMAWKKPTCRFFVDENGARRTTVHFFLSHRVLFDWHRSVVSDRTAASHRWFSPTRLLGQASLLVYMVHLDIVYNSSPYTIKQKLDPATATMLWIVVAILMVVVAWFRVEGDRKT